MSKSTDVRTPGVEAIAKKWKLSIPEVMRLVNDGAKVEKEHTKSLSKAKQVSRDHLAERPDYYKKLHKMEKSPISMKEGISAGPEREVPIEGDPTGSTRRLPKIDEGEKLKKAKKLAAAGLTAANLYTLGDVTSRAVEGSKTVSAKHDIVKAASALPGPAGYAASAINYAKQAYDKVKHMKEQLDNFNEGYASIGHSFDWAGDRNPRAKFFGKKPKPTTTKNDEKDDTYKGSKQGGKVKFDKSIKKEQIDELSAELVGKVSNARWRRGEVPSRTLTRAINKKFIESGMKKEKKETKMDTKEHINEALDNILENNLVEMKENLLAALQEKAMEKLEEKKKDIAANYFAQ